MISSRTFKGSFFDGNSSNAEIVEVTPLSDGTLKLCHIGSQKEYVVAAESFTYIPPVGKSSIRIRIGQSLVELPYDRDFLQRMSESTSTSSRFVSLAESHWGLISVLCSAAIGLSVFLYLYGLPIAGRIGAPLFPYALKELAGTEILSALDLLVLHPSTVNDATQNEVKRSALAIKDAATFPYPLEFHVRRLSKKEDIANAFALLPRTIVVTDGLLNVLNPSEVKAVIAHEFGHLIYDHGTQMLIRNSIISVLTLALFGADPGAIQGMALALVNSQYSQEHERAADRYAVTLLKKMGADPNSLASALEKMSNGDIEFGIQSYLSTHPLTSERIEYIRELSKGP